MNSAVTKEPMPLGYVLAYERLRERLAKNPFPSSAGIPHDEWVAKVKDWEREQNASFAELNKSQAGKAGMTRARRLVHDYETASNLLMGTTIPVGREKFFGELGQRVGQERRKEKRARARVRIAAVFRDGAQWAVGNGLENLNARAEAYALGKLPDK